MPKTLHAAYHTHLSFAAFGATQIFTQTTFVKVADATNPESLLQFPYENTCNRFERCDGGPWLQGEPVSFKSPFVNVSVSVNTTLLCALTTQAGQTLETPSFFPTMIEIDYTAGR